MDMENVGANEVLEESEIGDSAVSMLVSGWVFGFQPMTKCKLRQ